jgi:hypothetical protein
MEVRMLWVTSYVLTPIPRYNEPTQNMQHRVLKVILRLGGDAAIE